MEKGREGAKGEDRSAREGKNRTWKIGGVRERERERQGREGVNGG